MRKLIHLATLSLVLTSACMAQTISINWGTAKQTIDGFGGAAVDSVGSGMPSNLADFFFKDDGGNNIGLSIVRIQIVPTVSECSSTFLVDGCVDAPSGTILKGELATAQAAKARGVTQFFASQWSPSGIYKTNGSYGSGGALIGNPTNYTAIANEIAGFVSLMQSNGIPLMAVSVQNEPDINQSYQSCTWGAEQIDAFVPYLHTALAGSTGIMLPENSNAFADYSGYAATTMNDPAAGPFVNFLAQHGYGADSHGIVPWNTYTYTAQHLWDTEDSSQSPTYDGSISDALGWATHIHKFLTISQINAFVWWFLSDEQFQGYGTDNAALTDISGNIPLRAYATGNWSKFVRPGWHRVDVTNSGSLLVTAFTNSSGTQSAIVVVNTNSSAANGQAFNVGTQLGVAVTPWITSSTRSLASQSPVSIKSGTFTYTIPANSIVTFTNKQFTSGQKRVVLF